MSNENDTTNDGDTEKSGVAGFMQRARQRANQHHPKTTPSSAESRVEDEDITRSGPLRQIEHIVESTAANSITEGKLFEMSEQLYNYRLDEIDVTDTTCGYCAVGCRFDLYTKDGEVLASRPNPEKAPINEISTCVKGKFSYDFVDSDDRLTQPLIKEDGEFREASWKEALDLVADRLGEIKDEHGSDALGAISSSKATNEANYACQKFARQSLGTNNVDNCNRLCHSPTVEALSSVVGYGAASVSHDELENTDCYLITGSNTTEQHPVLATRIKQNVRSGADIYVFDPREIGMAEFSESHYSRIKPGYDTVWINGMIRHIIENDLHDEDYIEKRTDGFEELKESVQEFTPDTVEEIVGVPPEELKEAAEAVATADSCIFGWTLGLTEHTHGTENVTSMANLALITGHVGKPNSGLSPFRGQNNVQGGGGDMGPVPDNFPGYQPVTDDDAREKFEDAWGVEIPGEIGLTITEQFLAADEGDVKGMYVMGENPALSEPNVAHAEEILENLDFLAVQDLFMTETAEYADVVLPATSFVESNGTFTSSTRRVQLVKKAMEPKGNAKQDWQIVQELSKRFGYDWGYESSAEIMDEVADLTPIYGGISHQRLEDLEEGDGHGLNWPCWDEDHPGTKNMYQEEFNTENGKAQMAPTGFTSPAEDINEEYPLMLTTGRVLYQYHTGTMTHREEGLQSISGEAFAEIHPRTAADHGIEDGEYVRMQSRHGSVKVLAQVTGRVGPGTVFVPMHFLEDAAVNLMTNEESLDPQAHCPEYKATPVRINPGEADDRAPASTQDVGQAETPASADIPEVEPTVQPGTDNPSADTEAESDD